MYPQLAPDNHNAVVHLRTSGVFFHLFEILVAVLAVVVIAGCDPQATQPGTTVPHVTTTVQTPSVPPLVSPPTVGTTSESANTQPPASPTPNPQSTPTIGIQTVFVLVMENHNWSQIKGSSSAPYINKVLLSEGAHAEQYYNSPGVHPSDPNYLWLEAGTKFGITNDSNPSKNHQSAANHLVTLLNNKGISWKSYQEGISGKNCPLSGSGLYAPKHNPMVFFDDVTDGNKVTSPYCIAHVRPYTELVADLQNNNVARYNFITPDLCHDMHDSFGCATSNSIKNGDNWLSAQVPAITDSQAYKSGGVLFITWDEGENKSDGPIGMIVLSPSAKKGYSNTIHYTHSSTLRTIQELFGVLPLLGDAANESSLSDLFSSFP